MIVGIGNIPTVNYCKKGIKIKKSHKGLFTEYCDGKVTKECIDKAKKSNNPTLRKRATFAENARRWAKKHYIGGPISYIDDPISDKEKSQKLANQYLSRSNMDIGKTAYNALTDGWNNEQISAALANSYHETGGWKYLKQINGPASGLFMMEGPARKNYNQWLRQNNLKNSLENEVNYAQHLIDSKSLSTPWSNLHNALPIINKNRQSKGLNTFNTVEDLQDFINSIQTEDEAKRQGVRAHWQHRNYTTEQAYDDWYNGDVKAKTKAFEALFEKAGIPHMDRRYNAADAIYNNLHLFDPYNYKKVKPISTNTKIPTSVPKLNISWKDAIIPIHK